MRSITPTVALLLAAALLATSPYAVGRQRYEHFATRTPLVEGDVLILAFQGGREKWNDERPAVGRLARRLREMRLPGAHVETVENRQRHLAVRLVREAFDLDQDGRLDERERASVRLIIYGHSFGGAAVVKLARELDAVGVPILLTVQVDSVGLGDRLIPPNVARAANLFQRNGLVIRGEPRIEAADPARTDIVGNFEYDYGTRRIDVSHVSWFKKVFRVAHAKMEHDPEVWARVEELVVSAYCAAR
jgi:hypothetical protein